MSDEVIASEGAASGVEAGAEAQVETAQVEQQAAEQQQAAAPEYLTRTAFEEAMGGFSSSQQQRIDELNQQVRALVAHSKRMAQPAPQPTKTEPLVPPFPDFQNLDQYKFHDLLSKMSGTYEEKVAKLQERLDSFEQGQRQRDESDRIYQVFNQQTEEAKRQFPMFQDKDNLVILQNQVVAEVHAAKGNWQSVNVPAIAKRLQDRIYAIADAKYKAKLGGAPAGAPAGANGVAAAAAGRNPPPKGSASSPAGKKQYKEVTGLRDFDDNLESFLTDMGNQMAAD